MKQIVDKLNKIAKKIDESVEIPQTDLIIDSLDAITKAYGGTPNDSNLIVDKLEDIYNNIGSVPTGNIEITENGENINVAPYATATVNVSGGGGGDFKKTVLTVNNTDSKSHSVSGVFPHAINYFIFGDVIEGEPHIPSYAIQSYMVDIGSLLNISVEPSETLIIDLYYCYKNGDQNIQALVSVAGDIATAITNMTYDSQYKEYNVTDYTQDSALTVDLKDIPK